MKYRNFTRSIHCATLRDPAYISLHFEVWNSVRKRWDAGKRHFERPAEADHFLSQIGFGCLRFELLDNFRTNE
jgi:hypothetical protein